LNRSISYFDSEAKVFILKSVSPNISLILLAAGESSRLGSPKQLLPYNGKTLLQHSIDLSQMLGLDTFLVLGAFKDEILEHIAIRETKVVINDEWSEGLASSIRCGLQEVVRNNPDTEAILLVLCDQPFLTDDILSQMIEEYYLAEQPIIHCDYGDVSGPPTLFHKSLFPSLMELKGSQGAKKVVDMFPDKVVYVDFPKGKWDVDTQSDYQQLLKSGNHI
jgi:molybdenum cofactor cytidylyltransferase